LLQCLCGSVAMLFQFLRACKSFVDLSDSDFRLAGPFSAIAKVTSSSNSPNVSA
jgi:hypothetical protein